MKFDFEDALPTIAGKEVVKKNICFDFQSGSCTRGDKCPFKHTITTRSRMFDEVCKYWLRGLCKKGSECEFLHEYLIEKVPECFYFSRFGECQNPECVFKHPTFDGKVPECMAYVRGFCKYGPECQLKHTRKEACPNFMAGLCIDGPKCKMGHPILKFMTKDDIDRKLSAYRKRIESTGGPICHKCGEPGHIAPQCQGAQHAVQKLIDEWTLQGKEPEGKGCYHCNTEDHGSADCPKKRQQYMRHRVGTTNARGDLPEEDRHRTRCYRCGEEGHISRDCPLAMAEKGGNNRERDFNRGAAAAAIPAPGGWNNTNLPAPRDERERPAYTSSDPSRDRGWGERDPNIALYAQYQQPQQVFTFDKLSLYLINFINY